MYMGLIKGWTGEVETAEVGRKRRSRGWAKYCQVELIWFIFLGKCFFSC
jgi:hypothetical protein